MRSSSVFQPLVHWFVQTVVVCTIPAIALMDTRQPVRASTPNLGQGSVPSGEFYISDNSQAEPTEPAQYYQDYQGAAPAQLPLPAPDLSPSAASPSLSTAPLPAAPAAVLLPTSEAFPTPASALPSTLTETAATPIPTDSSAIPLVQPQSFSEPIWVVPTSFSTPNPVTVPTTPATPAVSAPRPAAAIDSSGPALTVTDIQVVGVGPELQQTVLDTVLTKPGSQVTAAQLKQDIAEILNTGLFATATIKTVPNQIGITVVYQVTPMIIQDIRLSGARVLTQEVANEIFKDQIGQSVNPTGINQGVQQINQWYLQNGYTLARVLSVQPLREGSLVVEVAEGFIADVKVQFVNQQGQTVDDKGQPIRGRTQIGFIQRQIKLQQGQVFQAQLAQESVENLVKLGIFSSVYVSFAGDAKRLIVTFNLAEGPARSINLGGGYNDELGVYALVSFQDNNFAGLAQQLSANVQVGLKDIQGSLRFNSPYRDTEPGVPGYGANIFRSGGQSLIFEDERFANGDRIRDRRYGGGFNLQHPLGPDWDGVLGINYTNISMRDSEGRAFGFDADGDPLTASPSGIDDLTTISFTATRDQRDNPVNTGKGSLLSLGTTQSLPFGRGNILSNRLEINYAQFIPVTLFQSPPDAEYPQVFAFNLQGGTQLGDLPPYNAFTLGGPGSVRGYGMADLAISRSYFLASAEYRFPVYRFLGGVVFLDFGSDLGSSGAVPGAPGVQRGDPGTGLGGGLGLRVKSPLGILRLDFGVTNQGDSRLQFGFGQKF